MNLALLQKVSIAATSWEVPVHKQEDGRHTPDTSGTAESVRPITSRQVRREEGEQKRWR